MAVSTIKKNRLNRLLKNYGTVNLPNSGYYHVETITEFAYSQLVSCEIYTWGSSTGGFNVFMTDTGWVYVTGTPNTQITNLKVTFIYED